MLKVRLLFILFISCQSIGLFAQSSFSSPIISDCDSDTREMVLLDINHDNILDLASISFSDGTATIMLGDGLGKFICHNTFNVGLLPTDIANGDFNDDGNQDLVILTQDLTNEVLIFLGDEFGNFENTSSIDVGGPNDVVVADFDKDQFEDLALAEGNSNVKISINNGTGAFGQGAIFEVGEAPIVLFTDDLNRDEIPDLVVGHGLSNDFLVMLGDGFGFFEVVQFYPTGGNPYSFQFEDVTDDGYKDLIVAVNSEESVIRIYEGNGMGGFELYSNIPTPFEPLGVAASDFDNDQKMDIAVTLEIEDEENIVIYKGNNNTDYSILTFLSAEGFPTEIFALDIDKNGFADIVVNDFRTTSFLNNAITNGIRDWVENETFEVFPNPSNGEAINLHFKNISSGKYTLKIIDILGNTHTEESIQLTDNQIIKKYISTFPKGIYAINLSNNSQQFSKKLIID